MERLYVDTNVLFPMSATLAQRERWILDAPSTGLVITPDGERLYLARAGQVAALDAATGERLGQIAAPGVRTLLAVASSSAAGAP